MLDLKLLFEDLQTAGLESWAATIEPLLNERMSENAHGNFAAWRDALASLPDVARKPAVLNSGVVGTGGVQMGSHELGGAREALIKLSPWRKGPFDIGGISIDSEWRSDLKWARVRDAISPLEGRLVLDVGSGNGYYSLRMRGEGARIVIGIDPTLLRDQCDRVLEQTDLTGLGERIVGNNFSNESPINDSFPAHSEQALPSGSLRV